MFFDPLCRLKWIPEVGRKQGEFYNCSNSRNSFQHIDMEVVLRQRQTVSPRREIDDSI